MRVSFNWLKNYVDIRFSAEALAEKLTMAGLEVTSLTRIDEDTVYEIEVTPNRTDCLSVAGVAREVATVTGKRLKLPKISSIRGKSGTTIPIQIQNKNLCRRYLGRVIKNIKVGPSPEWLIQRLEAMGIRAVNNIVDITNFCLLELGQPLHAFDLDELNGRRLIVRKAKEGEKIITIDGVERDLDTDMLVIADKFNPCALAGIMGGKDSEVSEKTKDILLESAYFDPINIHNTSRKLGLATQSSYRFERGIDLEGVNLASLRATGLIQKLARQDRRKKSKSVVIGKAIDKGIKKSKPNKVRLRFARVNKNLGTDISSAQIKEFLRKLRCSITRRSKESLTVSAPPFRPDITRETDLVEEVARLYGYDKIPLRISQLAPGFSYVGGRRLLPEKTYAKVRQILSSLGLHEIITYSLINRQALRRLELPLDNTLTVKNPLSSEQEILRPTLLVGMLAALLANFNRKNTDLKLFELSRIYRKHGQGDTKESTNLCISMAGKKNASWLEKSKNYTFYHLKGVVEQLLCKLGVEDFHFAEGEFPAFIPGRCASVLLGEETFGILGEIKSEILERLDAPSPIYAGEFELDKLDGHIPKRAQFIPLARYPSIERDISLVAPKETNSERIISLIKRIGRDLISKVTLFDQYFGEQIPQGFRGLNFSIEYRSKEKTLTAEEVDKLHKQVRKALTEELKLQTR